MRLGDLQVEIRPRTPGQTVALATRLLQHRPGPILVAWATSSLMLGAAASLIFFYSDLAVPWTWLFLVIFGSLFTAPVIVTAGHLVFSPEVSLSLMISVILRRFFPFTALFIIFRLLIFLGFNLLIIPGFYLWRYSWFLGPIVLLEGAPFGASFQRGRTFARGFSNHVLAHAVHAGGILVYLSMALASMLYFIVEILGTSIALMSQLTLLEGYTEYLLILGYVLALPFATLVWFFVYLDLRTRKEGWDLEIAFRARAARAEEQQSHA